MYLLGGYFWWIRPTPIFGGMGTIYLVIKLPKWSYGQPRWASCYITSDSGLVGLALLLLVYESTYITHWITKERLLKRQRVDRDIL